MCSDIAIRVQDLGKHYHIYQKPTDRLKQMLFGKRRQYYREFHALSHINFELRKGEVLGLVGRNGAGKSTLLQIICGTLTPSHGTVEVNGRVAALLELGAGFNPDFTGRENVYLNASVLGLSKDEIDARYDSIVEFAGIGDFIHQPVKTYSSGMYVRLAFAIATSVDPDILVVDEALSVGDGAFARKSFDRIMDLRKKGATILFCSHSMYHIEAICNRAMWLDKGKLMSFGTPSEVTKQFILELDDSIEKTIKEQDGLQKPSKEGLAKIRSIVASNGDFSGKRLSIVSGETSLLVEIEFLSDSKLPAPTIGITISNEKGDVITSLGSFYDEFIINRDLNGNGKTSILFEKIPLLKGMYTIDVFLACENLLYFYDVAPHAITLEVSQAGHEIGLVRIPHQWKNLTL